MHSLALVDRMGDIRPREQTSLMVLWLRICLPLQGTQV